MRVKGVSGCILLIGLAFCCLGQATSTGTCSLETYRNEGGERHKVEDFCVDQLNTDKCKQFVQTFKYSDMPSEFQQGHGVEKPYEKKAHLEPFYYDDENHPNLFVPGMDVNFGPPFAPNSKIAVKGYLMVFEWIDPETRKPKLGCRMFKVNDTDKNLLSSDLEFSFNLSPLEGGALYNISLYTIPTPSFLKDSKHKDSFVQRQITSGTIINVTSKNPGNWVPTVTALASPGGVVQVAISHAPRLLNLTVYEVKLVKLSYDRWNSWKKQRYVGQFAEEKRVGQVRFDKLEADTYKVVVQVKDPYRGVKDDCLCWVLKNSERRCRNSCGSVATGWFQMSSEDAYVELPTQLSTQPIEQGEGDNSVAVKENKTDNPLTAQSTWLDENETSLGKTDYLLTTQRVSWMEENETSLVVGILAAVTLVAFIAVLAWRCRRQACPTKQQAATDHLYREPSATSAVTVTSLSKKTIYIVFAEDHEAHTHLVEQLAQFLQVHCHCNVIFPPWEDVHGKGGHAVWSRQVFSRCDYVLFVDSEAVEKLLSSYINNLCYTLTDVSQSLTHKLLQEAAQQVFNNPDAQSKMIAVHFRDKCGCQGNLVAPHVFHLPRGIPDLLKCIHRLSAKQAEASAHSLPLQVKTLRELPEGKRLEEAYEAVHKFESDVPTWFSERFGELRPQLYTRVSKQSTNSEYSDESGIFSRQGSVSCQNIDQLESPPPDGNADKALFNALDASSLQKVIEEDRSVFTLGTNILNSPVSQEVRTSVIPPDWFSIGGYTSFSSRVRRFNSDVDAPSDITTFTVDCDTGSRTCQRSLSACGEDADRRERQEESWSQFEESLAKPRAVYVGGELDGTSQFERHVAVFNDDDHHGY